MMGIIILIEPDCQCFETAAKYDTDRHYNEVLYVSHFDTDCGGIIGPNIANWLGHK